MKRLWFGYLAWWIKEGWGSESEGSGVTIIRSGRHMKGSTVSKYIFAVYQNPDGSQFLRLIEGCRAPGEKYDDILIKKPTKEVN